MSKDLEILIVEESPAESEHLKHILEQHDHQVSIEHNGRGALGRMRQSKPQIVISAIRLPEMDGYSLCRVIKADEALKDTPVILLTSLSDPKDIIRGLDCGADNFVTKPYDEQLLMSRIEYIVLNRELRLGAGTQTTMEIIFGGEKYSITPERQQIVDLLISTYETAVQKNLELVQAQEELNGLNERLEDVVRNRTAELVEKVSECRAVQTALKEQQEFLGAVIDVNPNPVFVKDQEGRFTLVNKALAALYGATVEETIGKRDADFNGKKEEVDRILRHDKEVIETAQRIHIPEEPITDQKTGEVSWFQTVRTPLINPNGKVRQILGVATDITPRKRAEEKLRESEEWLRAIFDASRDGILVEDDGVIVYVNKSYTRMLGYNASEELLGRAISEILPPGEAERLTEYSKARLRGEKPPTIYEFKGKRKDGLLVDVEAAVSTSSIAGKKYVITAARDITKRKQAEVALIESEDRLQQSQKMEAMGTLTGGVAHDFNNLLTAILGNTQLALRKLSSDDPLKDRLIEVEKAGNRAAVLTRQLLAFSRRLHLERRTVNLNDTIGEIMKLLQRIIGEDIEVRVKAASNLSAVFADPAQIEQVVMNLAINARDAMPQGGQLTIETRNVELDEAYCRTYPYIQPGTYVEIRMSDTGTGMDEETQTHIFEPFFTTKEIDRGTGLGLSMVYGIVKQHDGHINVYSEVGHGTTFTIYLPVDGKTVQKEAQATQLPLLGGTETILVAEDEEALRNLARDVLEELDYTVLLAKNGEEAVEIYSDNRGRIDMLLFDVVMPRMGGKEASDRIRELGGDVPVIFITGYSSETVQSRFVKENKLIGELNAVVIPKPYNAEALGRKVREILDATKRK